MYEGSPQRSKTLSLTYWQNSRLSSGYRRFRPFHKGFEWWHTYWTLVLKHFETISPGGHESNFIIQITCEKTGGSPEDQETALRPVHGWSPRTGWCKWPNCPDAASCRSLQRMGFRFPSPSYYEERVISAKTRHPNMKIQEKSRKQVGISEKFWSILGGCWFRFFTFYLWSSSRLIFLRRSAECPNLRCWICRPLAMEALGHGESKGILAGWWILLKNLWRKPDKSFFGVTLGGLLMPLRFLWYVGWSHAEDVVFDLLSKNFACSVGRFVNNRVSKCWDSPM